MDSADEEAGRRERIRQAEEDIWRDPVGFMERSADLAQRAFEEMESWAAEQRRHRDGAQLAGVLPSDAPFPYLVVQEDSNRSVKAWIESVGTQVEGRWHAPLPDGRIVVWHPAPFDHGGKAKIVGSPDLVSTVIRQWVEEPVGKPPYRFAESALKPNPRWQRTLERLREIGSALAPVEVERALRADSLPHTPSVVSYALSELGLAERVPPRRGGMVTTFVVDVVFDPDRPSWKDEYRFEPRVIMGYPGMSEEEILRLSMEDEDRLDALMRYTTEVLHTVTASRNWTTTKKFWRRAQACCDKHARCLAEGYHHPFDVTEGHLPPGTGTPDDWINQEISQAVAEGRISSMQDEAVVGLIHRIIDLEQKRRASQELLRLYKHEEPKFYASVRERIRRALQRKK